MDRADALKLSAGFAAALFLAREAVSLCAAQTLAGLPMGESALLSDHLVIERARRLWQAPQALLEDAIPGSCGDLTCNHYRAIRLKNDLALWRNDNLSFVAEFFSAGYIYSTSVQIFVVDAGKAAELKYSPALFTCRSRSDEAGGEHKPGLFRFPLAYAHQQAERHGSLNSTSASGAHKFVISAGQNAVMDVDSTLFSRKTMTYAAIAPLMSRFYFSPGELSELASDKLYEKQRVARAPYPRKVLSTHAACKARLRAGRRSVRVEPRDARPQGSVGLIELPSKTEYFDNIVAFWRSGERLQAGGTFPYRSRFAWRLETPINSKFASVAPTMVCASSQHMSMRKFYVDFAGADGFKLCDDVDDFCGATNRNVELTASAGTIANAAIRRNGIAGGHRVSFDDQLAAGAVEADLRGRVIVDGEPVSEIWAYRWAA